MLAIIRLGRHGLTLVDVVLAAAFYIIGGHGITVGYHRLFAHRSFKAHRILKISLALAGSLALEGGVIGWVANHRRHHVFSDRPGDPHSPIVGQGGVRGLVHAHVGWLFSITGNGRAGVRDLLADRDLVMIDRLFPLWAILTFAVPFGLGYLA